MNPGNLVVMSWRQRLLGLLSLFAVFAVVAAACGDDDDDDSGDVATEEEAPADDDEATADEGEDGADGSATELGYERQEGGDLILAATEQSSFDPHFSSFATDIGYERMLWRGLYSLDAENNVVFADNGIAAGDPEVSEDGMTYTVTLNEGLLWSDGDDLTAEDYVAGILRTCNPVNAGEYSYLLVDYFPVAGCNEFYTADPATADLQALQDAVGVRAVDPLTIEFTLAQPKGNFPIALTLWLTFPVPTHLERFASQTPDAPAEWGTDPGQLVYNGPYVLTDYATGDSIRMEPNPNWPGAVQPTLDSITFLFIDDLAVAANAYRTGEIQATVANQVELSVLESEFPDELISVNVPRTTALQFQLDPELSGNEVLTIPEVRLALARATDRETLNEVVFQGSNEPTTSWIPESDSGRPKDQYEDIIGFDPEAARELLAEAGFPDGEGFPGITLILVDDASNRALGEFLQQQWAEILGIELELEIVDSQTRQDRFTNETFELSIGGWQHDYPDPENWILGLFGTNDSNNNTNCADEQIDALIAEAVFNDNNEERLDQYRQIEDRIIEIACGYAPIYHNNRYYLINSDLVGFVEFLNGGQDGSLPGDWFAEAWGIRA